MRAHHNILHMQSDDKQILESLVQNLFKVNASSDSALGDDSLRLNEDNILILQAWLGSDFLSSSLALLESGRLMIIEYNELKLLVCFKNVDSTKILEEHNLQTSMLNNIDAISTVQCDNQQVHNSLAHICTCGAAFRSDFKPAIGCIHTLAWYIYKHHPQRLSKFVPAIRIKNRTNWISIQDAIYKNCL